MSIHLYADLCVYIHIHIHLYIYIYIYVYFLIYIYIYIPQTVYLNQYIDVYRNTVNVCFCVCVLFAASMKQPMSGLEETGPGT